MRAAEKAPRCFIRIIIIIDGKLFELSGSLKKEMRKFNLSEN